MKGLQWEIYVDGNGEVEHSICFFVNGIQDIKQFSYWIMAYGILYFILFSKE